MITWQQGLMALGILFQLGGAGYVVWASRATAAALKKYSPKMTYGEFSVIDDLRNEMRGQYATQRVGFLWIALGAALQLAEVIWQVGSELAR